MDIYRNNENLKAPNASEYVSIDEFEYRTAEIIKCRNDPVYFAKKYFTIVTIDSGKQIIDPYPKQIELVNMMCAETRIVVLASRQSGKTTAYNIFALWQTIFYKDQNILICANTGPSASDFVSRIKLAYELLPMWLKPGVVEWNVRRVSFCNGSSIGSKTTGPSVRGTTASTLIIDEMAFIEHSVEKDFWEAVYPVISSSKKSKVIIVSTPNGTGNMFYELYSKAELKISDNVGFKPFRIDWWDVPGRDEEWKIQTIASYNGDLRAFAQEFGNCVSGDTFIDIYDTVEKKYQRIKISDFYELL